jgi:two-component system, HptB-dependent secretion and biofilm response regulator
MVARHRVLDVDDALEWRALQRGGIDALGHEVLQREDVSGRPCCVIEGSCTWHLDALVSAAQLKQVDVAPMVAEWAHKMGLSRELSGHFPIVLTELFVNALDHGILGLPSALKEREGGFERYFELRQLRLDELRVGEIHVVLCRRWIDGEELLAMRLRDSGRGFQWKSSRVLLTENSSSSGRGIELVRRLCRRVEYIGRGNEVYAEIAI